MLAGSSRATYISLPKADLDRSAPVRSSRKRPVFISAGALERQTIQFRIDTEISAA